MDLKAGRRINGLSGKNAKKALRTYSPRVVKTPDTPEQRFQSLADRIARIPESSATRKEVLEHTITSTKAIVHGLAGLAIKFKCENISSVSQISAPFRISAVWEADGITFWEESLHIDETGKPASLVILAALEESVASGEQLVGVAA